MDKIKNILGKQHNDESIAKPGQVTGTTANTGTLSGEGSHLAQATNTPAGTTSGLTGNQSSGITDTMGTSGQHHLGGDAASGAGDAGLAEREHGKYENERGLGSTTTGSGLGNNQSSGYPSATTTPGPQSSNIANKADPRIDSDLDKSRTVANPGIAGSNTTSGHHLGRDAAAVGTAGIVGEGIHHHRENERDLGANTGADYTGTNQGSSFHTGPSGTAAQGPHSTDTANRLDPNVNTSEIGSIGIEDAHHHSGIHGGGAEAADKHHHLGDTAVGAGGVGLAEHEHHKHQNERGSGVGATPGFGQTTAGPTSSSPGHDLGRDAAVGAGGVGLAEHEHRQRESEQGAGLGATSGLGQSTAGQSTSSSGHHLGRDAAIGAGGVGLAEHEHHKHENEHDQGSGTTSGITSSTPGAGSLPGPAPNTAGPHRKDWMNKLDPRVDANPTTAATTGQTSTLPSRNAAPGTIDQKIHHEGRDAAIAGGVGGAAYEADKHHKHDKDLTPAERDAKREHKHESKEERREHKDHHYGRDAAVAGGVGGAAYEADKHHHKNELNDPNTLGNTSRSAATGHITNTTGTISTAGPQSSNITNKADPTVDSDRSKDHHYGRDAAVAGGIGGAAYEADKHHKHDKDLTQAERDAKREHKHELKEEKKEHKESKGGLFGFLHRDKNKKYTPEEEAEFDRQENEHNSRKGRDAAVGGAAGAGVGALHESDKHRHAGETTDTYKPLPTAPGNHGIGTGSGAQNALGGESQASDHHYGRDAVLGAGAVGATGVAEHEHNKDHAGSVPLAEKPRGTDLGDKLHGVERNRGVAGSSGYPGTEGFGAGTAGSGARSEATTDQEGRPVGSGAALGAGSGLAANEHRKHDSKYATGATGNQTGQYDNTTGSGLTGAQQGHHAVRDAPAIGAAGLVGEHEYRKHEGTSQHSGLTGSNTQGQFDNRNTTNNTGSHLAGHGQHTGRDAVGVGAAGLVGEHEYRKHDTTSGLTGSDNQSNISGSNTSGFAGVNQGGDGRNRLHKDPPADHPAAQTETHDPASGAERETMLGQGREHNEKDTGVVNSHVDGGINAASNY